MSPPLPQLLAQLTLYLVPAKLDVGALDAQITELGGTVVGRASDARIIITALRGRPRLERALGTNVRFALYLEKKSGRELD
jgi:DNA polymerase mu